MSHPVYINGFDDLNENDIWFAIQWFLYTKKLGTDDSLIELDNTTKEDIIHILEHIEKKEIDL